MVAVLEDTGTAQMITSSTTHAFGGQFAAVLPLCRIPLIVQEYTGVGWKIEKALARS